MELASCDCDPNVSKYEQPMVTQTETYKETVYKYDYNYGSRYVEEDRTREVIKPGNFQCVQLAGQFCYLNLQLHCVKNSKCEDMSCQCENGFAKTSNGLCGLDYGKPCDEYNICSDHFTCGEGKCGCKDGLHQIHNGKTVDSKCIGIVASKCSQNSDCISNAICELNNKGVGRCQCAPQYVENGDGRCELAYGSSCQYAEASGRVPEPCDKLAGLKCRNNICSCPEDSMVYDEERRECLQLVGARCNEDSLCVPSANCMRKRSGLSGICECPDGFEENDEGGCFEIEIEVVTKREELPTSSKNTTEISSSENEIEETTVTQKINEASDSDPDVLIPYETHTGPL